MLESSYHKTCLGTAEFECGVCKKRFPLYYINKRDSYWGNRGRYNFRGARANFNKHTRACGEKYDCLTTYWQCPKCEHIGDYILKAQQGIHNAKCPSCNYFFNIELKEERIKKARKC